MFYAKCFVLDNQVFILVFSIDLWEQKSGQVDMRVMDEVWKDKRYGRNLITLILPTTQSTMNALVC